LGADFGQLVAGGYGHGPAIGAGGEVETQESGIGVRGAPDALAAGHVAAAIVVRWRAPEIGAAGETSMSSTSLKRRRVEQASLLIETN
jgi:hypothetical protein